MTLQSDQQKQGIQQEQQQPQQQAQRPRKKGNKKFNDSSRKHLDNYAKYSAIGFQMLAVILIGVFGGRKLDQWIGNDHNVFTIIFSLLSVFAAIYLAIKDFIKLK